MIAAVRLYQREISPKRPPVCHFTPSCSAYAVEALEQHGARRGSWLTREAAGPVPSRARSAATIRCLPPHRPEASSEFLRRTV